MRCGSPTCSLLLAWGLPRLGAYTWSDRKRHSGSGQRLLSGGPASPTPGRHWEVVGLRTPARRDHGWWMAHRQAGLARRPLLSRLMRQVFSNESAALYEFAEKRFDIEHGMHGLFRDDVIVPCWSKSDKLIKSVHNFVITGSDEPALKFDSILWHF